MGRLARALGDNLDIGLQRKGCGVGGGQAGHRLARSRARKEHLGELVELAATLLGSAAADKDLAADPEVAEAAGLLSQVVLKRRRSHRARPRCPPRGGTRPGGLAF